MSNCWQSEAQIIAALKQVEAGLITQSAARQQQDKRTIYAGKRSEVA